MGGSIATVVVFSVGEFGAWKCELSQGQGAAIVQPKASKRLGHTPECPQSQWGRPERGALRTMVRLSRRRERASPHCQCEAAGGELLQRLVAYNQSVITGADSSESVLDASLWLDVGFGMKD